MGFQMFMMTEDFKGLPDQPSSAGGASEESLAPVSFAATASWCIPHWNCPEPEPSKVVHTNVVDGGLMDNTAITAAVRNGASRVISLGAADLEYAKVKFWADKPDGEWKGWTEPGFRCE